MLDGWKKIWATINTSQGVKVEMPTLMPPMKKKDLHWGKIDKIRQIVKT